MLPELGATVAIGCVLPGPATGTIGLGLPGPGYASGLGVATMGATCAGAGVDAGPAGFGDSAAFGSPLDGATEVGEGASERALGDSGGLGGGVGIVMGYIQAPAIVTTSSVPTTISIGRDGSQRENDCQTRSPSGDAWSVDSPLSSFRMLSNKPI
ncbi:MAG: hypothetical protein HY675_18435 [Chloroflexi bacterium]|nr:hypothetical protein [Chloroflexota bacterium]